MSPELSRSQARGCPLRYLLLRSHALRNGLRATPLSRSIAGRHTRRHLARGTEGHRRPSPGFARRSEPHHHPLPAEGSLAPLSAHGRSQGRARGTEGGGRLRQAFVLCRGSEDYSCHSAGKEAHLDGGKRGRIDRHRSRRVAPYTAFRAGRALHAGSADKLSRQRNPADFSPDGNQVAFSWDGEKEGVFDVYVKLIGPGAPLRLTSGPGDSFVPAGRPMAPPLPSSAVVPKRSFPLSSCPRSGGRNESWAPSPASTRAAPIRFHRCAGLRDSKAVIVSANPAPGQPNSLVFVSLENGETRTLTHPPPATMGC